jgi:hypothetical protein
LPDKFSGVPDAINTVINVQAEEALAKLQVRVPWNGAIMDFSLVAPPIFVPNSYFLFKVLGRAVIKQLLSGR